MGTVVVSVLAGLFAAWVIGEVRRRSRIRRFATFVILSEIAKANDEPITDEAAWAIETICRRVPVYMLFRMTISREPGEEWDRCLAWFLDHGTRRLSPMDQRRFMAALKV